MTRGEGARARHPACGGNGPAGAGNAQPVCASAPPPSSFSALRAYSVPPPWRDCEGGSPSATSSGPTCLPVRQGGATQSTSVAPQTARRWRRAIELLARRPPGQPIEEVARQAGVSPRTLARWLAEGEFQRLLVERTRDEIRRCLPAAKDMLLKKALEEGDKECLKMIISICGLLDPRKDEAAGPPAQEQTLALSDEELLERIRWFRQLYQ